MESYPPLAVKVWGPLACFTRPELKAERVSYPVPTPSAARGLLEAIFWKPECRWQIEEIWVLEPIRYFSIVRNEVRSRVSARIAATWARTGHGGYVSSEDRTQRHTLALREVAYMIRAQLEVQPGVGANVAKFRDQFRRRVAQGRCFTQPYFGCREFAASFAPPDGSERPIAISDELGPMLFDLDYASDGSGRGTPRFFAALLEKGVLRVPSVAPTGTAQRE